MQVEDEICILLLLGKLYIVYATGLNANCFGIIFSNYIIQCEIPISI